MIKIYCMSTVIPHSTWDLSHTFLSTPNHTTDTGRPLLLQHYLYCSTVVLIMVQPPKGVLHSPTSNPSKLSSHPQPPPAQCPPLIYLPYFLLFLKKEHDEWIIQVSQQSTIDEFNSSVQLLQWLQRMCRVTTRPWNMSLHPCSPIQREHQSIYRERTGYESALQCSTRVTLSSLDDTWLLTLDSTRTMCSKRFSCLMDRLMCDGVHVCISCHLRTIMSRIVLLENVS